MVGILGALGATALAPRRADANPLDVFGLGSRHAAQANAGAATIDDADALYYDPAGLVEHPGVEIDLGAIGAYSHLRIGNDFASLSDPVGAQVAMRAPLPLAGPLADRIVVGLALHLLPGNVARVIAPAPDQPFYPLYGDRLSRIVVLPGLAVRLPHGFAIGAAANVLAGLTGTISAAEGATRAIDARVDERVPTIVRAIAGVTWQAAPAWRLAAVYREQFAVPFATTATTEVAGEPIDLDLSANGQFTPDEVVLGVGWSPGPVVVSLDLQWSAWSEWSGPYVHVDSELPLIGPVPGQSPQLSYSNTYAVRLGFETTLPAGDDGWIWRGGYSFETSPIPKSQPGVTNLLDGPKNTIALGAGYAWPHAARGRGFRLDAHVMSQFVGKRTITKQIWDGTGTYDPATTLRDEVTDDPNNPATLGPQISNPGYPSLRSGGEVVSAGVSMTVGL